MEKPKFIKNMSNNRIMGYTDALARKKGMLVCDKDGHIIDGRLIFDTQEIAPPREKTKFLGNLENGHIFNYTEDLAANEKLVSVDSHDQWELVRAQCKRDGFSKADADMIIFKAREAAKKRAELPQEEVEAPAAPKVDEVTAENDSNGLPNIGGLPIKDAKIILMGWAKDNFDEDLDGRSSLSNIIKDCEALLANFGGEVSEAG